MTRNNQSLKLEFAQLENEWPVSYAWAIEQMPGPAYCCSHDGVVVHCNSAAMKIWDYTGTLLNSLRWDAFAQLLNVAGNTLDKEDSPAAQAAAGRSPPPTELLALCYNGQLRRIVIHAKPVFNDEGEIMGALCCLTDVSEKSRLQERVHEEASSRKEFLDMLAHELRNPLSPIMSVAGVLQRRSTDATVTKLAGVVERQTKQLARFIGDLLDASRIDCFGEVRIKPRICTEDEILVLALDTIEPDIDTRKQSLALEVNGRNNALRCDPERVAQAISNILSNASAFSSDGEQICLKIFVEGELLRVDVIDHGAGIAPENLPHIFEPFQRGATPVGRASSGAGLGLTIAKGVCEAHGGSINVRSAGLGEGTTVSLALPVAIKDR